jgi:hypothetical protein
MDGSTFLACLIAIVSDLIRRIVDLLAGLANASRAVRRRR